MTTEVMNGQWDPDDFTLLEVFGVGEISSSRREAHLHRILAATDGTARLLHAPTRSMKAGLALGLVGAMGLIIVLVTGLFWRTSPGIQQTAFAADRLLALQDSDSGRHIVAQTAFYTPSGDQFVGSTEIFQRVNDDTGALETVAVAYDDTGTVLGRVITIDDSSWVDVAGEVRPEEDERLSVSPQAAAGLSAISISSPADLLTQFAGIDLEQIVIVDDDEYLQLDVGQLMSSSERQSLQDVYGMPLSRVVLTIEYSLEADQVFRWRQELIDASDNAALIYDVSFSTWDSIEPGSIPEELFERDTTLTH